MSGQSAIGFVGLSHLGIVHSLAAAVRGFPVVAFDEHEDLTKSLTAGKFPVREPGLEELFCAYSDRIRYTHEVAALTQCNLILFTLDVQTDEANTSDLAPLEELIANIAALAKEGTILAVMSQVPPGFCRKLAAKLRSGLKLYYQVETLVFGDAVERAVHPERYVLGCANPKEPVPDRYRDFLNAFECPILTMDYESAELCKIAINCFLVSSITTTNMLAELCENIRADWSEIAPALRLDKRIGPHAYLNPGLGLAGGNLERDLVTVQRLTAESGCDDQVLRSWQQNSAYTQNWVLRRLFGLGLLKRPAETVLAMWGLAYKPETHSTKNSPSLLLLRSLASYRWLVHDPVATIDASEFPDLRVCGSPLEAVEDATALVVMTPWKQFARLPLEDVRKAMRGHEVLDPYAVLDGGRCRELHFHYHRLGAQSC